MNQCVYDPDTLTCQACGHVALRLPTFRDCLPPPKPREEKPKGPPGPGHYLTRTLGYFGIHYTPDCLCKPMAEKMDRRGPDWCESPAGMKEILSTMKREHKRRSKRRVMPPWSDAVAAGLVHAACALARRAAA
jgi:hypothetical protein